MQTSRLVVPVTGLAISPIWHCSYWSGAPSNVGLAAPRPPPPPLRTTSVTLWHTQGQPAGHPRPAWVYAEVWAKTPFSARNISLRGRTGGARDSYCQSGALRPLPKIKRALRAAGVLGWRHPEKPCRTPQDPFASSRGHARTTPCCHRVSSERLADGFPVVQALLTQVDRRAEQAW